MSPMLIQILTLERYKAIDIVLNYVYAFIMTLVSIRHTLLFKRDTKRWCPI